MVKRQVSKNTPDLPDKLDVVLLKPETLYRISRYDTGEPYFGTHNANRFDSPHPDKAKRFGTCYLGTSLEVAVAESILHDLEPFSGCFLVDPDDIEARYLLRFKGASLTLADLTGTSLKKMGGLADLTGSPFYGRSKRWSAAIHRHVDQVDGFVYASRHMTACMAVVLFDRAAPKIQMVSATKLTSCKEFGAVATAFNIRASLP